MSMFSNKTPNGFFSAFTSGQANKGTAPKQPEAMPFPKGGSLTPDQTQDLMRRVLRGEVRLDNDPAKAKGPAASIPTGQDAARKQNAKGGATKNGATNKAPWDTSGDLTKLPRGGVSPEEYQWRLDQFAQGNTYRDENGATRLKPEAKSGEEKPSAPNTPPKDTKEKTNGAGWMSPKWDELEKKGAENVAEDKDTNRAEGAQEETSLFETVIQNEPTGFASFINSMIKLFQLGPGLAERARRGKEFEAAVKNNENSVTNNQVSEQQKNYEGIPSNAKVGLRVGAKGVKDVTAGRLKDILRKERQNKNPAR